VGGNFGAQLKRSGFDALIVTGAAVEPVYLWIQDGDCEIREATHLWGKGAKETQAAIREELGEDRAELTMIGPGGENVVRYACVMNGLKDAAGRSGMGAVMGSKKLKAVAALGTANVEGADHDTIRAMARRAAQEVREGTRSANLHKWGTGGGPLEGGIDMEELREAVHTYYGMMGWVRETGVPTEEKLHELGVGWAGEHLPG
jgi:aldehyde:ferredoxin oxidoreductase